MKNSNNDNPTIHNIGLTLAGAVSAGAYTAGVLDYLFETLYFWYKKNQVNQKDCTFKHDVKISIMSGASAGGIASILSTFALLFDYNPEYDIPEIEERLLYKSWVEMQENGTPIIEQFLKKGDDKGMSVLNTEPIDKIAKYALNWFKTKLEKYNPEKLDFPKYISDDFDLVCTITNLNGLEYNYKYKKTTPVSSSIFMHSGYFRYKFNENKSNSWSNLNIRDENHRKVLTNTAKATGAFPLMLKANKTFVKNKYINAYQHSLFPDEQNIKINFKVEDNDNKYEFVAVDGGMINNEPLGYTNSFLKEKLKDNEKANIIIINPFPTGLKSKNKQQNNSCENNSIKISCLLHKIFSALRNQVMFRQKDLIDALNDEDTSKFIISPVRKENGKKFFDKAIASGSLNGFGGFFNQDFRKHDFYLGRKNCKDFLRFYFLEEFSDENLSNYSILKGYPNNNNYYLPIIPDFSLYNLKGEGTEYEKFKKKLNNIDNEEWDKLKFPINLYNEDYFNKLEKLIEKRLKYVLPTIFKDFSSQYSSKQKGKSLFKKLNRIVMQPIKSLFLSIVKIYISKKGANKITHLIMEEFKEYGFIEIKK